MSDGTSIEWASATWQVSYGCSRVSKGCEACYAERFAHRGLTPAHRGLTVIRGGRPGWTGEVRLAPDSLGIPLKWRKPRRIFVNSMSDLFHERVPFDFIAAVFGVMGASPRHTFLVLTKRPARAVEFFEWVAASSFDGWTTCHSHALYLDCDNTIHERSESAPGRPWPLPNVHLGVSAEDQATWDERVPLLLQCPAAVRWVSAEPLLGPIEMRGNLPEERMLRWYRPMLGMLDWIVVGGESGPGARPFDVAWARSIVGQARDAGVPVFVKQLGARPHDRLDVAAWPVGTEWSIGNPRETDGPHRVVLRDRKGGDMAEWPEDLRVRELPEVRRG